MRIKITVLKDFKPHDMIVEVDESNYWYVRKDLEKRVQNIINILKNLQKEGKIKSIKRPKNKQIKDFLNDLTKTKKEMKDTIKKLKILFN